MSNDDDCKAAKLCRKQPNLQIQNLFATKIDSKDDEEINPLTVQEIADDQLAHPQYKIIAKTESLKIRTLY